MCAAGGRRTYKRCCYGKGIEDDLSLGSGRQQPQYPIGTDDKATAKIAAGIILRENAEPIMQRWLATDMMTNPKVQQELQDFFLQHGLKQVAMTEGNMGCPHEEDCPFCPFWKGKQGSRAR